MKQLGTWRTDSAGMPCFEYTGNVPYHATLKNGQPVKLPEDPWFLLGNYRMTLFTHVSGTYELISGQRSWARLNQGDQRNSGLNTASISINGKCTELTGMQSPAANPEVCRRIFGCGFASYICQTEEITVSRTISVKPSADPHSGASGFLLTVDVKNRSSATVQCVYQESVGVHFAEIRHQTQPEDSLPLRYHYDYRESPDGRTATIHIRTETDDPLLISDRSAMAVIDGFPPAVFIHADDTAVELSGDPHRLTARCSFALVPEETKQLQVMIGFSFEEGVSTQENIFRELQRKKTPDGIGGAFAEDWQKALPRLENESDEALRQELRWHAYCLEAMATYSEFYNETKIPQGTIYDYDWGVHASSRDHFQHALPLIYYNQPLAKSILRYMLKRTTPFGEIRLIEYGNGYADNERYFTSDQQLFFFLLLSEYLRVTKDTAFLSETVQPYPVQDMAPMKVAKLTEKCFTFLRDTIGTGSHGLIRLMNSDWNDAVYYIEKAPYNNVVLTGESHMNSAMAVAILQTLIPQLHKAADILSEQSADLRRFASSMEQYRIRILEAYRNDLGNRVFPRRMYFNGKAYGESNMFLEPMGFTLQIAEMTTDFKQRLYQEMQKRLYKGETSGAREQEQPEFDDPEFDKGSRENGGFWWALNGPVIVGVSQFDPVEANRLLRQMTLRHLSEVFPQYWSSYWSAADQVESSLIPETGLPDQSLTYPNIPVYCAHPHAWVLYCWYYLKEKEGSFV